MSADTGPMPVDLARTPAFSIGVLAVSPPTREVTGPGVEELLEPRVMQVLVALARRHGEVVSRDDLVRDCWSGRIIGDDAVHRCIAKVRRLGEASGAFELETIARVGYRLTASSGESAPAQAPVAAPAQTPVLAVLPFDNLSGDADLAFFSDGVSEEILHALSRNTNLKVIGRASSFQFRGPSKVVRTIAGELKTSHLLDGSVRRAGERVRVSAHLLEAATQTMVWSDRFDRDLADIFALQDEIAAAVAAALDIRFAPPKRASVSTDAYDLYLRGAVWSRDVSIDAQVRALMLLDEAVTRAPDLARAWGELALTRAQLRYLGAPNASAITTANIVEPAERALALDPHVQAAWAALFLATPPFAFREAEALFARCRRAGFDVPLAYAIHLLDVGRVREAQASLARAQSIDPYRQMQVFYAAAGALADGDLANARRLLREATERWPQTPLFSVHAAEWSAHARDWREVERLADAERFPMGPWTERVALRVAALREGPPRDLAARLREAEQKAGGSGVEAFAFAAHVADADAAHREAGAITTDILRRPGLGVSPLFLPLYAGARADPRFAALCVRLGLADYWEETGAWPDCAAELPYDLAAACRAAR